MEGAIVLEQQDFEKTEAIIIGTTENEVDTDLDGYEYLYFVAFIYNNTSEEFKVTEKYLDWGKWGSDNTIPKDIPAYSSGFFRACGKDSALSGTEGYVKFQSTTTYSSFQILFDVPLSGSSSQKIIFDRNYYIVSVSETRHSHDSMVVNYVINKK